MIKYKNIIFLSIDALSQQCLENFKHLLKDNGGINFLINNGHYFNNAYTSGIPTQIAFPSIFSSSYPLDFGGYDDGVKNRPNNMAEILSKNGYKTIGISTSASINHLNGYMRGFDEYYDTYNIAKLVSILRKVNYSHFKLLYNSKIISKELYVKSIIDQINQTCEFLSYYCDTTSLFIETKKLQNTLYINRYNLNLMKDKVLLLKQKLSNVSVDSNVLHIPILMKELEELIKESVNSSLLYKTRIFYDKLCAGLSFITKHIITIKRIDSTYPTGKYITDLVLSKLKQNENNNCFIWAHFMDFHEATNTRHRSHVIPFWRSINNHHNSNNHHWNHNAFSALHYVNQQIIKILDYLKLNKQLEKSLIVLCSDHGLTPLIPTREETRPRKWFYEEFIKVPIIIYGKGIKKGENNRLCGNIDILPTLIDILKIKNIKNMVGESLITQKLYLRDHLIIESLGMGMCDFDHKPIHITLRSGKYKFFWCESSIKTNRNWIFEDEWKGINNSLFDLTNDPLEQNNIIEHPSCREIKNKLQSICESRCEQLRKANKSI